jgi:hypothetical protein
MGLSVSLKFHVCKVPARRRRDDEAGAAAGRRPPRRTRAVAVLIPSPVDGTVPRFRDWADWRDGHRSRVNPRSALYGRHSEQVARTPRSNVSLFGRLWRWHPLRKRPEAKKDAKDNFVLLRQRKLEVFRHNVGNKSKCTGC